MAVPVVEAFTFNTAGSATTSVDLTKPAGVQVGELLIMLVGNEDNTATTSFAAITGWTKAYEYGNATPDTKIGMYWRIADGTEAATETIDWTATGTDFGGGWYLRVSGVDTDSPIHISGTSQQSAGASSLASLSVTTTLNDCLIFSHMSGDGGDTYPFSSSGTGWPTSIPTNQELQDTTATSAWAGAWITRSLATAGASGNHTWGMNVSDGIVTVQFAVAPIQEGIQSVAPTEFNMDTASITISGLNFGATQGTGTVYISDANTLAGSVNEVEIANGINTWSDTSINLDLTGLNATELANLHTLGPGQRYVIVVTNASDEYGSTAITLHRPDAFVMSLSTNFAPGTTTQRLTGLTGTFAGGRIEEALNPSTTNTDVATDGNREDVANIQATADARAVSYDFRVLYGGNVADTITQTPQVTITEGAGDELTTVAGTSAVGSLALGARALLLAGMVATSSVGAVGNSVTVGLTGVSSSSNVGNVGVTKSGSLALTGIESTGAVGSVGFTESGNVGITGIEITSSVGDFGISVGGSQALTGIESTGEVGTVDNETGQVPDGQEATSGVGSLAVDRTIAITGVENTSAIGVVTASAAGATSITGVEATTNIGSVGLTKSGSIGLTGIESTASVGTVSVSSGATVGLTGIELTSAVGSVGFAESGQVALSGVEITSAVGDVVYPGAGPIELSGVESTASVGSVALPGATYGGTYNASEYFPTGSTVTITIYDPITGNAVSVDDSSCSEIPGTGVFIWDTSKLTTQPSGYQEYVWSMTDSVTVKGGIINMFDAADSAKLDTLVTLTDELHKLQGLDASNPMTVTPISRVAGTISQDITGDGIETSTVTRT